MTGQRALRQLNPYQRLKKYPASLNVVTDPGGERLDAEGGLDSHAKNA